MEKKPANRIHKQGEISVQGKRNDLIATIERCNNIYEVMDGDIQDQVNYVKYPGGLTKLMARKALKAYVPYGKKRLVIYIYGPTGVGKTWAFSHDEWGTGEYAVKYPGYGPYANDACTRINLGNQFQGEFMKMYQG